MPAEDPCLTWAEPGSSPLLPGIRVAVASGERMSAAFYWLEPGAVVPEHEHNSEEFGQVIRGSLELTCGGRARMLAAGEAFLLPGGLRHSARAGDEGCHLLECYAPPRVPTPPAVTPFLH